MVNNYEEEQIVPCGLSCHWASVDRLAFHRKTTSVLALWEARDVAQRVRCLLSMYKVQSSNPQRYKTNAGAHFRRFGSTASHICSQHDQRHHVGRGKAATVEGGIYTTGMGRSHKSSCVPPPPPHSPVLLYSKQKLSNRL